MIKVFTAEEFFRYLLSFCEVFIWEGGDSNNGVYIKMSPERLKLIKRKDDYAIMGEILEENKNACMEGGFVLTGNVFHCDICENGLRTEVSVKSDFAARSIKLELVKGRTIKIMKNH